MEKILLNSDFNKDLSLLSNSHGKNICGHKIIHSYVQDFVGGAHRDACTLNYLITILYPNSLSVEKAWLCLENRICSLRSSLCFLPVYSALIGIEVHKKSANPKVKASPVNLANRKTLKGKPHLHICLTLYNDFLCPDVIALRAMLRCEKLEDIEIQALLPDDASKHRFNVKKAFLYCAKELADPLTQSLLSKYTPFQSSCILLAGHKKSVSQCEELVSVFTEVGLNLALETLNSSNKVELPFVKSTDSECLKVSNFVKGFLESRNWAIWEDKLHVCQRIPGSIGTWEQGPALSELYSLMLREFPIKAQELLINSRSFNMFLKDYSKLNLKWLPQVNVDSRLIELKDGVYNFKLGEMFNHGDWGLTSCASYWLNNSFNDLVWPKVSLSLIDNITHSALDETSKSNEFVLKFAEMFHDKEQNDKVIYLHGLPGSGKSALMEAVLRQVFKDKVGIIGNYKNQFQFALIKNKDIVILNEFNPSKVNYEDLLLLTEGNQLVLSRKYELDTVVNKPSDRKKHIVALGNLDPSFPPALARRMEPFYLEKFNFGKTRAEEQAFQNSLLAEAVSFCVFCNVVYLRSKGLNPSIPISWQGRNWPSSLYSNFVRGIPE